MLSKLTDLAVYAPNNCKLIIKNTDGFKNEIIYDYIIPFYDNSSLKRLFEFALIFGLNEMKFVIDTSKYS